LWRLRHNTARAYVFAAYEPQPIDPLLIGEFKTRLVLAHVIPGFAASGPA